MGRQNVLLGSSYEEIVDFSRAVRVGPFISVDGTAPIGDDGEIIRTALEGAGANLSDAVRTRMMLTDASDFETVASVRTAVDSRRASLKDQERTQIGECSGLVHYGAR